MFDRQLLSVFSNRTGCVAGFHLALLVVAVAAGNAVQAQTAQYAGIQSVVASNGLTFPCGVAVDGSGNVYVADQGPNSIFRETLSGGSYSQTTVVSGLNLKCGIAVDGSGNVYVADYSLGEILKESPSASGYTQSVVASGLNFPNGIAVDGNGNVFIADTNNNRVLKETPSSGTYIQSIVFSGVAPPVAVAVDGTGNVYIAFSSYPNSYALKETLSKNGYIESTVTSIGLFAPSGIAVDKNGTVFISDALGNGILEETPSREGYVQTVVGAYGLSSAYGIAVDRLGGIYVADRENGRVVEVQQTRGDFGRVNIGNSSSPISLVFRFDGTATIAAPVVVTQGVTGLDFADAGTGSCTTNGTRYPYVSRNTCTVDVIFKPESSGTRYGGVDLLDNSGNLLANGYVEGVGVGPHVNFAPGFQRTVASASSLSEPLGVAVDGAGNVYVADFAHDRVVKETLSGSTYSESTVVSTAPASPTQIAVDGNGDVFVHCSDGRILKETPSVHGYLESTVTNNSYVAGMAVDGSGNVYLSEYQYSSVLKETLWAGNYTESTIPTSGLLNPFGIAVDGSGNLYIADPNNLRVVKETLLESSYVQSTIPTSGLTNSAQWIGVDGNGNVYISDFGSKLVLKETPAGASYVQSVVQARDLSYPSGIAIDGRGNVYIADTNNNQVIQENLSDAPSLSFATIASGMTSADSPQTVRLENVGNAGLNFAIPPVGNNPNISNNFTLDSSGASACPLVHSGALTGAVLGAGNFCEVSVSFAPSAVGDLSGSLSIIDNDLNASSPSFATQTIALKGSSTTPGITTISWATPTPISYGSSLGEILNASAERDGQTIPGVFSYTGTPANGVASAVTAATVLDAGSYTLTAAFTPSDPSAYASATATTSLMVNKAIPAISLIGSPNAAFVSNPVTFTASISSTVGTPTGSVSFYEGNTLLGEGTLASGVATYATSSLAAGSHFITPAYSGDRNFLSGIQSPLTETVEDFTFGTASGGAASQTITPGGQASYTFIVAPPGGTVLAGPIVFKVTGLPAGSIATFSPSNLALGSAATNVALTVTVPRQSAVMQLERSGSGTLLTVALGLLILPFAGGLRSSSRGVRQSAYQMIVGLTILVAGVAGCGGNGSSGPTSSSQPRTYTLSITASSGSLSHTIAATLNVE